MMAMTTSNSISVNARRVEGLRDFLIGNLLLGKRRNRSRRTPQE
jgi:hypothetical protein